MPQKLLIAIGFVSSILSLICQSAAALPSGQTWSEANVQHATLAVSRRGPNPAYRTAPHRPESGLPIAQVADDGEYSSGNFNALVPLLRLPGRGAPLELTASFASQVWSSLPNDNLQGLKLEFDLDNDVISPGWSLGFGKIVSSTLLVRPNHSRERMVRVGTRPTSSGYAIVYTVPGSAGKIEKCCSGNDFRLATLKNSDGSWIEYSSFGRGEAGPYFPTKLVDANGNFSSITYRDAASDQNPGKIDFIRDTRGQKIDFRYDAQGQLVTILGPGIDDERRAYARFVYQPAELGALVGADCRFVNARYSALKSIIFPSTGRYFEVSTPSVASGVSRTISEGSGVIFVDLGHDRQVQIVNHGVARKTTTFEYPFVGIGTCLQVAPKYASRTESWWDPIEGRWQSTLTSYSESTDGSDQVVSVAGPDQSIVRQFISQIDEPTAFRVAGMLRRTEVVDRAGKTIQSTDMQWESRISGMYGAPRLAAVVERIDTLGREKLTKYRYDSLVPSLLVERQSFDYAGRGLVGALRSSELIEYVRAVSYLQAGLTSLPARITTMDRGVPIRVTSYIYDEQVPLGVGDIAQHLARYEPKMVRRCARFDRVTRRCVEYKYVLSYLKPRGMPTSITRLADPQGGDGRITTTFRYDSTGNLRSRDAAGYLTQFTYTHIDSFSQIQEMTIGSRGVTVATSFVYDLATGLMKSRADPDGTLVLFKYEAAGSGWRRKAIELANSACYCFTYDDNAGTDTLELRASGGSAEKETRTFDGRGRVRSIKRGTESEVQYEFDHENRVVGQSEPFNGAPSHWWRGKYDPLGRLIEQSRFSELTNYYFYDEPTLPPGVLEAAGHTVRSRDAWGVEAWSLADSNDNPLILVEPSSSGDGSVYRDAGNIVTRYSYDTLGRLTDIVSSGNQWRRFEYDGLSRLVRQALPERSASLDSAGNFVGLGRGLFSDVYEYDARSNIIRRIDARGVAAFYKYDNDPLNRIREISYQVGAATDHSSLILPSPSTTFYYEDARNRLRVSRIDTPDVLSQEFDQTNVHAPLVTTTTFASDPTTSVTKIARTDDLGREFEIQYPERSRRNLQSPTVRTVFSSNRIDRVEIDGRTALEHKKHFADGRPREVVVSTASGALSTIVSRSPELGMPHTRSVVLPNGNKLSDVEYRYRRQAMDFATGERVEEKGVVGRVTAVLDLTDFRRTEDYVYDKLGRLSRMDLGDTFSQQIDRERYIAQLYGYDESGNRNRVLAFRLSKEEGCEACPVEPVVAAVGDHDGAPVLEHDARTNRIIASGYLYDAAGNLISMPGELGRLATRFTYDAAGRLVRSLKDDGSLVEGYKYDYSGRVVTIQTPVRTRNLLWHADKVMSEYESAPELRWIGDRFYAGSTQFMLEALTIAGPTRRYPIRDERGVRAVLNDAGQIAEMSYLLPFGNPLGALARDSATEFMGYDRFDSTNLDYALSRFYDFRTGAFTQPDSAGAAAMSSNASQTLNAFSFVGNDPINVVDPTGQLWIVTWWRYCYNAAKTDCGEKHVLFATWVGDSGSSPGKSGGGGGGGGGSSDKSGKGNDVVTSASRMRQCSEVFSAKNIARTSENPPFPLENISSPVGDTLQSALNFFSPSVHDVVNGSFQVAGAAALSMTGARVTATAAGAVTGITYAGGVYNAAVVGVRVGTVIDKAHNAVSDASWGQQAYDFAARAWDDVHTLRQMVNNASQPCTTNSNMSIVTGTTSY